MKEIRVGILGTGGIADKHANSLKKLPGVRLVALCNHHVEKAQQFNERHGKTAQCFSDFGKMLQSVPMDALYICMPPGVHDGETEAAAQRGLHLFLEKPIALSLSRAEAMAAAVRKAGVKCQVGYHMRHGLPVRKLREMIRDGSAGKPLFFTGRFFSNALYPAWWRNPAIGGGQLIEQAIHIYDLARCLFGDADVATGFCGKLSHARFPDYQVDDNAAATIRFKNGAIASILSSNSAEPLKWTKTATILCENVSVEMDVPQKAIFVHHEGRVSDEFSQSKTQPRREEVVNDVDCYDEISRNFIAGIRDNEPLRSGIEDGLEGLRLVTAVAKSSAQCGAPQRL